MNNKTYLIIIATALFSLLMMLDISISSNEPVAPEMCSSISFFSTAFANGDEEQEEEDDDGGSSVSCKCGLIWGTGCKSSNYGGTCAEGPICGGGAVNC